MGPLTDNREGAGARAGMGEDLLARHGDALYRYAMARLRSAHASEDAVQETLLAALSQSAAGDGREFQGRSAERTWLTGILRHKVIDQLRRTSREPGRSPHDAAAPAWEEFFDRRGRWRAKPRDWGPLTSEDPHQLLERAEVRQIVAQCVGAIPPRLARAFLLREADGIPADTVCQTLGISAANLWTLLHRARVRLRQCLDEHGIAGHGGSGSAERRG